MAPPQPPPPFRAAYTHPSLPLLPSMLGTVEWDDWSGQGLFMPDAPYAAPLLSLYGYDADAGLFLGGASVLPLP